MKSVATQTDSINTATALADSGYESTLANVTSSVYARLRPDEYSEQATIIANYRNVETFTASAKEHLYESASRETASYSPPSVYARLRPAEYLELTADHIFIADDSSVCMQFVPSVDNISHESVNKELCTHNKLVQTTDTAPPQSFDEAKSDIELQPDPSPLDRRVMRDAKTEAADRCDVEIHADRAPRLSPIADRKSPTKCRSELEHVAVELNHCITKMNSALMLIEKANNPTQLSDAVDPLDVSIPAPEEPYSLF